MLFIAFQEASTGVVTIEDTDPDAVQVVLDYIYTGGEYSFKPVAKLKAYA